MTNTLSDTSRQAERVQINLLRRAPAWRKIEMLGELNAMARALALSGLRQRYPNASPYELRRRLADLLLGTALAARAYGVLAVPQQEPSHAE